MKSNTFISSQKASPVGGEGVGKAVEHWLKTLQKVKDFRQRGMTREGALTIGEVELRSKPSVLHSQALDEARAIVAQKSEEDERLLAELYEYVSFYMKQ